MNTATTPFRNLGQEVVVELDFTDREKTNEFLQAEGGLQNNFDTFRREYHKLSNKKDPDSAKNSYSTQSFTQDELKDIIREHAEYKSVLE